MLTICLQSIYVNWLLAANICQPVACSQYMSIGSSQRIYVDRLLAAICSGLHTVFPANISRSQLILAARSDRLLAAICSGLHTVFPANIDRSQLILAVNAGSFTLRMSGYGCVLGSGEVPSLQSAVEYSQNSNVVVACQSLVVWRRDRVSSRTLKPGIRMRIPREIRGRTFLDIPINH
jgi:hypothetical protein